MNWLISHRKDKQVRPLADRHYNRQKVGAADFVPPGRCMVLKIAPQVGVASAFWVTSWPFAEWVKHAWAGAWICSAFRNEGSGYLSSDLILQAVAATRWKYREVPDLGMVTFINPKKINSENPGYCFKCAGFVEVGKTKSGLIALQMLPEWMPKPRPPIGVTCSVFGETFEGK